jgi:rubrerythrin
VADTRSVLDLLAESRTREKAQTLFYRALAAEAEVAGLADESERLNELHADEQHHLSRATARLIELGGSAVDLRHVAAPDAALGGWEDRARAREREEIVWYEHVLTADLDVDTRALVAEILESERHHHAELRGKWMSA